MRLFLRYALQITCGVLAFAFLIKGVINVVASEWSSAIQVLLYAILLVGAVWFFAQLWPTTNEMTRWTPTLSDRAAKVLGCLSLAAMGFYVSYITYVKDPSQRSSKTQTLIAIFGLEVVVSFGVMFGLFFLYWAIRGMFEPSKK